MIVEPSLSIEAATGTPDRQIDERYAQHHALQIGLCLRSLVARRDFLTVHFGGWQIVTQVLEVDSSRARFVFDFGSNSSDNAALACAERLTFRSQPSGIRTEFVIERATPTTFEGRPAFEAPFPALLYYVQRREYYRVQTPMFEPFVASGLDTDGTRFRLDLQDMSLGGIALRTFDARFEAIERGRIWEDVALRLGTFGAVMVDLEVVAPRRAFTLTGERHTVLGCRFLDLQRHEKRMLQRAITQLEMCCLSCTARA